MKTTIPKLGLILIAVIVFPTIFFSAYEINNISRNERVVDSIYSSQLSSIIFSLNQYSDDVMSSWGNQIDNPLLSEKAGRDSILNHFFQWYPSVQSVYFTNNTQIESVSINDGNWPNYTLDTLYLSHQMNQVTKELDKIKSYLSNDYRKILPVKLKIEGVSMIVFALKNKTDTYDLCGIIFQSENFVRDKLGPKIQGMAQDKFIVSIFNENNEQELYSNDFNNEDEHSMRIREDLWLIEDCKAGMFLIGDPIEQMVQKRMRTNVIMIILMDIVLLLGAWFVYRNVKQALHLAQMKSEFVSNVSHEIKTPLAVINMYSETLDMGRVKDDDKKREYYKVINKEAKRLSSMVNKILNFSKIESGKRRYHFIDTDLNELLDQICSSYQHHFDNSSFSCAVEMIDELPLIKADEEALTDAISNLIDNAMKYSIDNKHIKITTGVLHKSVFVSVIDSGIGIHEKDQKLVFDKFYRVSDGDLALKAKGSGIGLNIVKHIVESHHGKIQLTSTYGKGSQFTLFFPIIS